MIALAVVASSFTDEDIVAEAKTTETALVPGK
jgi:hypothetical protein